MPSAVITSALRNELSTSLPALRELSVSWAIVSRDTRSLSHASTMSTPVNRVASSPSAGWNIQISAR